MKKVTFIIFVLIANYQLLAINLPTKQKEERATSNEMLQQKRWNASINLVRKLISKLQDNTPFSQADEHYFFGAPLEGYVILKHYNPQIKYDDIRNDPHQHSYICELLRLHKHHLILKDAGYKIYANGSYLYEPPLSLKNRKASPLNAISEVNPTYIYVTLQWERGTMYLDNNNKQLVITLKVFCDEITNKASIQFDSIYYNGVSFCKTLGFEGDLEKGMPYLSLKKLEELQAHMEKIKKLQRK